jgi:glutaredoxin
MLKIYTLEGCDYCKELLASLDREGIHYEVVDAEGDLYQDEVNEVEDLLNTFIYPIVVIVRDGVTTYISSSEMEGVLEDGSTLAYRYEHIPHLVHLIRKLK